MSAPDDVMRRPNGEPVLEGLDPELADIARRLVADAQGFVPRAAFARQLASELRSSAGAPAGPAGSARLTAPDDLGGSTPQPPLWAKVAVGLLSLTLVYGLIASIFRPSTTPPVAEPTSTVPASATSPARTATVTPSATVTPTPSVTPTAASNPTLAGRAAGYIVATPIATPTPTRTLAATAAATPTTRRRTATATRTSPPPPTDTVRPSSTPPPTEPPTPTDRPKPPTEPSPTPPPPEGRPATATPHGEPTATPTSEEPPRAGDCREACTRKSNGAYRDCVGRGGSVEDCRRQADEMRAECIRTECEPTPDP